MNIHAKCDMTNHVTGTNIYTMKNCTKSTCLQYIKTLYNITL